MVSRLLLIGLGRVSHSSSLTHAHWKRGRCFSVLRNELHFSIIGRVSLWIHTKRENMIRARVADWAESDMAAIRQSKCCHRINSLANAEDLIRGSPDHKSPVKYHQHSPPPSRPMHLMHWANPSNSNRISETEITNKFIYLVFVGVLIRSTDLTIVCLFIPSDRGSFHHCPNEAFYIYSWLEVNERCNTTSSNQILRQAPRVSFSHPVLRYKARCSERERGLHL